MVIQLNDFFSRFEHTELPIVGNEFFKGISNSLNDPNGTGRHVRNTLMRNMLILHAELMWKAENKGAGFTEAERNKTKEIINKVLITNFDLSKS